MQAAVTFPACNFPSKFKIRLQMLAYRYPLIAREGWVLIACLLFPAAVLQINSMYFLALPFWILAVVMLWFFRDPPRKIPASPLAVVAPVDGVVAAVQEISDAYVGCPAVSILMRKHWYRIIAMRSPMEGKIQKQWYGSSGADSGIHDGNRFAQWIQSDEGDDVSMTLQPLSWAGFFRCYSHAGERIGQGQRCGVFPFPALVEVRAPTNSHVQVKVGDKVKAGADKLATLVH